MTTADTLEALKRVTGEGQAMSSVNGPPSYVPGGNPGRCEMERLGTGAHGRNRMGDIKLSAPSCSATKAPALTNRTTLSRGVVMSQSIWKTRPGDTTKVVVLSMTQLEALKLEACRTWALGLDRVTVNVRRSWNPLMLGVVTWAVKGSGEGVGEGVLEGGGVMEGVME
jgi:hypothetical protein